MTTAPDRIAVIAMHLARTDRRALSQAWYDALHQSTQHSPAVVKAAPTSAVGRAIPKHPFEAHGAGPSAAAPNHGSGVVVRSRSGGALRLGSGEAPPAAQRLQTKGAATVHAPRGFARTVALGSARVRLLVRTDAGGTRIVALCAGADRDRVARALAQVRVALAGAGVTLAA